MEDKAITAEQEVENENVDTENKKKRQRSEKQKERVRQYKKKTRKLRRQKEAEGRNNNMCKTLDEIAALLTNEIKKQIIDTDKLSETDVSVPVPEKDSTLRASVDVFLPSTAPGSEAEKPTLLETESEIADTGNKIASSTCKPKKKRSVKQLERARQYKNMKMSMRAEIEMEEIIRNMTNRFYVTAPFMTISGRERMFLHPILVPPRDVLFPVQKEVALLKSPSQMLMPGIQPEVDVPNAMTSIGDISHKDNISTLKTSESMRKYWSEKQQEKNRLFHSNEESTREEKQMEEIYEYRVFIPNVQTAPMKTDEPKSELIGPTTRDVFPGPSGNFSSLTESSFVPITKIQSEKNVPTSRGFIILPSARNVPESLRTSAITSVPGGVNRTCISKPVEPKSTQYSSENHAITTQRNTYPILTSSACDCMWYSAPRQPEVHPTYSASTDTFDTKSIAAMQQYFPTWHFGTLPLQQHSLTSRNQMMMKIDY